MKIKVYNASRINPNLQRQCMVCFLVKNLEDFKEILNNEPLLNLVHIKTVICKTCFENFVKQGGEKFATKICFKIDKHYKKWEYE